MRSRNVLEFLWRLVSYSQGLLLLKEPSAYARSHAQAYSALPKLAQFHPVLDPKMVISCPSRSRRTPFPFLLASVNLDLSHTSLSNHWDFAISSHRLFWRLLSSSWMCMDWGREDDLSFFYTPPQRHVSIHFYGLLQNLLSFTQGWCVQVQRNNGCLSFLGRMLHPDEGRTLNYWWISSKFFA